MAVLGVNVMAAKTLVIVAVLGFAGLGGATPADAVATKPHTQSPHARASDVSAQQRGRRYYRRPRIEINRGGRLLYRQCTDGYELQYRPSGTVLFPYQHCWWVRG